jgi:hypothetical protein
MLAMPQHPWNFPIAAQERMEQLLKPGRELSHTVDLPFPMN